MTVNTRMRICIAGAGAIGSTLAVRLCAAGHDVSVLARGKTLAGIRENGLVLHDQHGTTHARPHASDKPDFGIQDLILVCTKSQDLHAMLPQIVPLIGEETIVVPMNNGVPWWYFHREGGRFEGEVVRAVDPDNQIPSWVPGDHVIGSVVFITAEITAPGEIRSTTPHLVMLGEPSHELTPRLAKVAGILGDAGIEARQIERIREKLWVKIMGNVSSNPLSVITGGTLEQIYGDPTLVPVSSAILQEVRLVAASYGVRTEFDPQTFLEMGRGMGAFKTSMLQDYERGRPLEIAAIGDAVLEMAARYDIPMPMTRAIVDMARFAGKNKQQQ